MVFIMDIIRTYVSIREKKTSSNAVSYTHLNIVLMNWYYEKKVGLNIALFFRNLIQPSVILGIAAVEGIIVKHFFAVHSWSAFLVQGALFMSVYAVLLYFFGMNNKEKDDVRHMLKRGAK